MRSLFTKRQKVFIKLTHKQTSLPLDGLDVLKAYMDGQNPDEAAATVGRKEKDADEARRISIHELNKTFVTPFDGEDIFILSRTIDDVLEYAYSTVDEMQMLKVEPLPHMQRMASLLRAAAYELLMAVKRLDEHTGVASGHAQDIEQVVKMLELREVDRHCTRACISTCICYGCFGASDVGGPVSTTQVVSSAIMGVSAADRVNKVRWGVIHLVKN